VPGTLPSKTISTTIPAGTPDYTLEQEGTPDYTLEHAGGEHLVKYWNMQEENTWLHGGRCRRGTPGYTLEHAGGEHLVTYWNMQGGIPDYMLEHTVWNT
jgi:hypothetical protein